MVKVPVAALRSGRVNHAIGDDRSWMDSSHGINPRLRRAGEPSRPHDGGRQRLFRRRRRNRVQLGVYPCGVDRLEQLLLLVPSFAALFFAFFVFDAAKLVGSHFSSRMW